MMITAEIARAKTMLVDSIEKEITNAAENGYLDVITKDFYTDSEYETLSAILVKAGFHVEKVVAPKGAITMKYGIPAYNIFISWERKQVTPR